MTPSARLQAAIDLLEAIDTAATRPADAVANDFFRARRFIGSGDRRAASDRVWTVLRTYRRLEWWLGGHASPRLLTAGALLLEGWSWDGLRTAFSGGRFAPAAFSPAEQAALRGLEGHTLDHPNMPEAVRLEIPDWLLPPLHARFGTDLAAELAALGEPAPLDLRANLLRGSRDEAAAALLAEGIAAEPTPVSPWGLRVSGRRPVTGGSAFQSGLVEIQDEGSQLVAALVDAGPGMRVADYCAGAGGKTLAIAAIMGNRGHIVACDVHETRLEAAMRRFRRAGVHNAERHLLGTGDKWGKRQAGKFDRVLVDAPCTGSGTWRRNPDARRHLAETDLAELREKQAAILDEAAKLVRRGGRLIYATCSLLPAENEEQIEAMRARHPEFSVVPLQTAWKLPAPPPGAGPYLSLTPRHHGTDGFFAAVLERGSGA